MTMVNMLPGGRTPLLRTDELAALGVRLIVFGLPTSWSRRPRCDTPSASCGEAARWTV